MRGGRQGRDVVGGTAKSGGSEIVAVQIVQGLVAGTEGAGDARAPFVRHPLR